MKSFEDIRGKHIEELVEDGNHPADPPVMLLLRRKAIRLFTGGERVALYSNDKLGVRVSIPYRAGKFSKDVPVAVMEDEEQTEEMTIGEAAIHNIHRIAKTGQSGSVVFGNGKASKVDAATAHKIIALHLKLTPENKAKVEKMVSSSPEGLTKVAAFAVDNHKVK